MSPSEWILGGTFLFLLGIAEWNKKSRKYHQAVAEYNRWDAGFTHVEVRDGFVSTKAVPITVKTLPQVYKLRRDKNVGMLITLAAIAMFSYGCYVG
ncbi:Putative membrane protein [Corynebacterium glyciniphilum AJ 3170]|uniref:Putative membrane protein n=1 Tax=Corynebacterium glyciniphilum AJ 3170 TaxID=1404245 RepID=X5EBQ6_9CORY|nr:hypothetical protein [Corynebacterium glyciniphilum]AHW64805.1 Putative membrane protein [Corynebacterium glyciniphilum AJ 3170]